MKVPSWICISHFHLGQVRLPGFFVSRMGIESPLEKCSVDQAGVIVDELKQEHLEGVASLKFRLGAGELHCSDFPGYQLKNVAWSLQNKMILIYGIYATNGVGRIPKSDKYLNNDCIDGGCNASSNKFGILDKEIVC